MDFRELVTAPIGWFIVGGLFSVTTALVFLIWMGPLEAVTVLVALSAVLALWFASLTYRIDVSAEGIRVGRSLLAPEYCGGASALSPTETQELAGPQANARAWLKLPPYTRQALRVEVADTDDPHPYWLVGSRRPEECAAAVRTLLAARVSDD